MTLVDQSLVDSFFNSGFEEEFEVELESGFKPIQVHYYDKYQVAKMFDQDIESSSPMIECRSIDVEGVKRKGIAHGRGIDYVMHEVQPDGEGFTKITLTYD